MRIACIGWGSLIWKKGNLKLKSKWFTDGPWLPVEFTRQSKNDRITLVLTERCTPIPCLWSIMDYEEVDVARNELIIREGTQEIRTMFKEDAASNATERIIQPWLQPLEIDAVMWTGLGPKIGGVDRHPSCDEVLAYLRDLGPERDANAKEYVCRAPKQVNTEYRRRIEEELGWTCVSNI